MACVILVLVDVMDAEATFYLLWFEKPNMEQFKSGLCQNRIEVEMCERKRFGFGDCK
jgi:hypothetical protein